MAASLSDSSLAATTPLLSSPFRSTAPQNPAPTHESLNPPPPAALSCWCLPLNRLCCWREHPIQLRLLDCVSQVCFWTSGAYHGAEFSRSRWQLVDSLNRGSPGLDSATGVLSYDTSISAASDGRAIALRIFKLQTRQKQELPIFVYLHGGGFCIGSAEMNNFHVLGNKLAQMGFVVVSVNYRLAPEFPFPAAVEDCYEAVDWAATRSGLGDVTRLVLGGDSAGGNLSCVVASLLRDQLDARLTPAPAKIALSRLVLIYPALFHDMSLYDPNEEGMFISRPVATWFMNSYAPAGTNVLALSKSDRRFAPLLAGLHGFPPTIVISAGHDVLRHENRLAVDLLREANVSVIHHHFDNVPHGFVTFHFMPQSEKALEMLEADLCKPI